MASSRNRLTPEQRKDVLARLQAGEPGAALAREYGVSRQAVCFLKQRQEYITGVRDRAPSGKRIPKMKLTDGEWQRVIEQLRESTPVQHGLQRIGDDPIHRWNLERGLELARLITGRSPSRSKMKTVLAALVPPPTPWWRKPEPPVRLTLDMLTESQRADPGLADYLLSDVYWRIQQREFALALEEYQRYLARNPEAAAIPDGEEDSDDWLPDPAGLPDPSAAMSLAPGQRLGKHRGNRQQAPKSKRKRKTKGKKRR